MFKPNYLKSVKTGDGTKQLLSDEKSGSYVLGPCYGMCSLIVGKLFNDIVVHLIIGISTNPSSLKMGQEICIIRQSFKHARVLRPYLFKENRFTGFTMGFFSHSIAITVILDPKAASYSLSYSQYHEY